ncbi:MAG: hypothetical protein HY924_15550 [Elusimicrobia bacterium]|nr:hypothetical protein [Elusimicrobiota bacterium]
MTMYNSCLAVALFFLPGLSMARTLDFKAQRREIDVLQLAAEIERATGLTFIAKCSSCAVNGSILWKSNTLSIAIYEEPREILKSNFPPMSLATWTADLRRKMEGAVVRHLRGRQTVGVETVDGKDKSGRQKGRQEDGVGKKKRSKSKEPSKVGGQRK